jgi:hypothetical protein
VSLEQHLVLAFRGPRFGELVMTLTAFDSGLTSKLRRSKLSAAEDSGLVGFSAIDLIAKLVTPPLEGDEFAVGGETRRRLAIERRPRAPGTSGSAREGASRGRGERRDSAPA